MESSESTKGEPRQLRHKTKQAPQQSLIYSQLVIPPVGNLPMEGLGQKKKQPHEAFHMNYQPKSRYYA